MTLITYPIRVHFADAVLEHALLSELEKGRLNTLLLICDAALAGSEFHDRIRDGIPRGAQVLTCRIAPDTDPDLLAREAAPEMGGVDAIVAFGSVAAARGRGERLRLGAADGVFTVIDESYNANPASMRAAIALLDAARPGEGGRKIAVLGDMREMGDHSAALHAGLSVPLKQSGVTDIWLAGEDMAHLRDALGSDKETVYFSTSDELSAYAVGNVRPGDVLMVKSSNGTGFGRIVAALTANYPAADAV